MFGGSKSIVGLDIGSSSIKAAELRRSRDRLELVHAGLEPLANDLVVDSMIMDSTAVSGAIGQLFSASRIKGRNVAIAVSGHSVIVKRLTLPAMSEQQLAERLPQEAAQNIPFEISDVNLDYQVLAEAATGEPMDVLLVAVKKDKIVNYTGALSMAGKTANVVDVDGFALQNCYQFNYQPPPTSTVALLNVGASLMNINIVRGSIPLFTRDVSVGGYQYTDALQKAMGLSFSEAEALKLDGAGGSEADTKRSILKQVTELIVLEIHKTFDFFRSTAPGEPLEAIYLAGGSSRIPGLVETLTQEFAVPVERLNPFQRIELADEPAEIPQIQDNPGQMAVAVGLALRSFEDL
jgi:type IV pilus assembly protein PilM